MTHTHTHDGIDWPTRLTAMRRADAIEADANRAVAERLAGLVRERATVVDIGPGSGGMSAALARVLRAAGGGRIVLVDAVPELLAAAQRSVEEALGAEGEPVEVETVQMDAASGDLPDAVAGADLVWASGVVHHLPDQRKGIDDLVAILAAGGWLALSEGGLPTRCLPWDLGIGEPGLADRLTAARDSWFAAMRAGMDGAVRLGVGWGRVLAEASLIDVSSFSHLIDLPAPTSEPVRLSVVDWLTWHADVAEDHLGAADWQTLQRLLDPDDPAYVGARDDVFMLSASTVYLGRKPS